MRRAGWLAIAGAAVGVVAGIITIAVWYSTHAHLPKSMLHNFVAAPLDLSDVQSPFSKVEPFRGLHLGETYDEVLQVFPELKKREPSSAGYSFLGTSVFARGKILGYHPDFAFVDLEFEDSELIYIQFLAYVPHRRTNVETVLSEWNSKLSRALGEGRLEWNERRTEQTIQWLDGEHSCLTIGGLKGKGNSAAIYLRLNLPSPRRPTCAGQAAPFGEELLTLDPHLRGVRAYPGVNLDDKADEIKRKFRNEGIPFSDGGTQVYYKVNGRLPGMMEDSPMVVIFEFDQYKTAVVKWRLTVDQDQLHNDKATEQIYAEWNEGLMKSLGPPRIHRASHDHKLFAWSEQSDGCT
ncbi:MAG: hypothetical protein ACREJQ_02270, partial [bacterium]